MRSTAGGLVLGAVYLAVASWTLGPSRPIRPFFDGSAPPPPYRYVSPPDDLADFNETPEGLTKTLAFMTQDVAEGGKKRVVEGASLTTDDAQVILSVPAGVFEPETGATGVKVTITPLDPVILGEPPEGRIFEGNAAEVTATYVPSGEPAEAVEQDCSLGGCLSIVMRYPIAATQLWRLDDDGVWHDVGAQASPSTFSLFGSTEQLGRFALTAISGHVASSNVGQVVAFALGGIAVVAAVFLQRVRTRRKPPTRGRTGQPKSVRGRPGQRKAGKGRSATRGKPRR